MNDPNGPIFFRGRYHMFHQYNPQGAIWGNMNWAYATSPDMFHWQHEPMALSPTPGGPDQDGAFGGSAILDNGTPTVIYTGVAPRMEMMQRYAMAPTPGVKRNAWQLRKTRLCVHGRSCRLRL